MGRTFQSPRHMWICHFHRPDAHGWWWPGGHRDNGDLRTGLYLLPAPGSPQKWFCIQRWKKDMTQFSETETSSACEMWGDSCSQTGWSMTGQIEFHTWIPRGPRPLYQHLLLGWSGLSWGRGCRSWLHLSLWLLQSDSHPFYLQSVNYNQNIL